MRGKIAAKQPSDVLRAYALQHGMRTMRQDGLLKVQQGITTLDELDRVVPPDLA